MCKIAQKRPLGNHKRVAIGCLSEVYRTLVGCLSSCQFVIFRIIFVLLGVPKPIKSHNLG